MYVAYLIRNYVFYITMVSAVILAILMVAQLLWIYTKKKSEPAIYNKVMSTISDKISEKSPAALFWGKMRYVIFYSHIGAITICSGLFILGIKPWYFLAVISLVVGSAQLCIRMTVRRVQSSVFTDTEKKYIRSMKVPTNLLNILFIVYPMLLGVVILWALLT